MQQENYVMHIELWTSITESTRSNRIQSGGMVGAIH